MRGTHERMVLTRGPRVHVPSARRYIPSELTGWFADFEPLIRATFLNAHCPGMNVVALVVTAYMLLRCRIRGYGVRHRAQPGKSVAAHKNLRAEGLHMFPVLPGRRVFHSVQCEES